MVEIIPPVASAAGGSLLGVLIAYMGLKSRIDSMEKHLETYVTNRECGAKHDSVTQRMDNASNRFDRIDTKLEVLVQMAMRNTPGKEENK